MLQPTKMQSIWCQIPLQHCRCNKFTSYCVVSTCSRCRCNQYGVRFLSLTGFPKNNSMYCYLDFQHNLRNWASPPLYCYLGFRSHSCTHSLAHALTHSRVTHSLTHSLTHNVVRGGGCASAVKVIATTNQDAINMMSDSSHGREG